MWKIVSGDSVRHNSERSKALIDLPDSRTGSELQQLICAANWTQNYIPCYAVITQPLLVLTKKIVTAVDGRAKYKLEIIVSPRSDGLTKRPAAFLI